MSLICSTNMKAQYIPCLCVVVWYALSCVLIRIGGGK